MALPRRGLIRQAVVVSLDDAVWVQHAAPVAELLAGSLLIDFEGINGFLPNQDTINAFIREADRRVRIPLELRGVWESLKYQALDNGRTVFVVEPSTGRYVLQ